MLCARCGATLDGDDAFCPKCGARRGGDVPAPADHLRAALERVLGHQYDILRLLGRGGMGAVYLAREKALERAVAIKVLPPEFATDADSRERFRREARVAARLTHPNIVPLHTFGDVDGMLYFVMGYVKGESLAERLRREGKLPEEEVRRILAEVADALHYAHKQGVVHRDIKPDNVLLEAESGRPMLTDFGVAKAQASGTTLTAAGAVVGTPYYMSPEQASGAKEIDGRSDLYSLGVMGYQMLSGRVPFEGASVQDVLVQHVTREPAPLAALVPNAPADLEAAIVRALAKDPNRRWQDARALCAALGGETPEEDLRGWHQRLNGAFLKGTLTAGTLVALGSLWAVGAGDWHGMVVPGFWSLVALASWLPRLPLAVHGGGVPRAEASALFFRPPKWWPFWWPTRWRRRGDVYGRLPRTLRRLRALRFTAFGLLYAWALTTLAMTVTAVLEQPQGLARAILVSLLSGSFLGASVLILSVGAGLRRWGRALGLDAESSLQAGSRPTSDLAFWGRQPYSGLLLPATTTPRPADPRSPQELAEAIRDLVGQLPSGTQATVSEAADAARQLLGTLALLDAEIGRLAQDADPQELEAVETKLRAFGPEAPTDGEVRREKRALLAHQRDLLRRLDRRLGELREQRTRLADLLRTMWLQVANLRAEAARDTLAVTEISGRIRALCSDIGAHVRAAETVRVVAGG